MGYLEELRAQGQVESSGSFSLDTDRAFQALQRHGSKRYLERFVTAAVASGASHFRLTTRTSITERYASWDGRLLTREDLARFEELALADPVLKYLALGLFAAAGQGYGVELVSMGEEGGLQVRLQDSAIRVEDVERRGPRGNHVVVRRPWNTLDLDLEEFRQSCEYCPLPVVMDGKLLNRAYDVSESLLVIELEGGQLVPLLRPPRVRLSARLEGATGFLTLGRRFSSAGFAWCVHGARLPRYLGSCLGGLVRVDELALDLTADKLVEGDELGEWERQLREAASTGVARWLAEGEDATLVTEELAILLADSDLVTHQAVASARARLFGLPLVDPGQAPPDLRGLLPGDLAWRGLVLPWSVQEERLVVAMVDPGDLEALEDVRRHTGLPTTAVVAARDHLTEALTSAYGPDLTWMTDAVAESVVRREARAVTGALPEFVDWATLETLPPPPQPAEVTPAALLRLADEARLALDKDLEFEFEFKAPGWRTVLLNMIRALWSKPAQPDYPWGLPGLDSPRPAQRLVNGLLVLGMDGQRPWTRVQPQGDRLVVLQAADPNGPWTEALTLPRVLADELAASLAEQLKGKNCLSLTCDGIAYIVCVAARGPELCLRTMRGRTDDSAASALGAAVLACAREWATPLVVGSHDQDRATFTEGRLVLERRVWHELWHYLQVRPGVELVEDEIRVRPCSDHSGTGP